jgi:hypothetical protein
LNTFLSVNGVDPKTKQLHETILESRIIDCVINAEELFFEYQIFSGILNKQTRKVPWDAAALG